MKKIVVCLLTLCLLASLTGCRITINGREFGNGRWDNKFEDAMDNWGEEFGESMGEWGEEFGESMGEWGEDFGESMGSLAEEYGNDLDFGNNVDKADQIDGKGTFTQDYSEQDEAFYNFNLKVCEVNINMDGPSDELYEAEYTYNSRKLEILYSNTPDLKTVNAKQNKSHNARGKARIDASVHSQPKTEIVFNLGVGEINANLTDVNLKNFTVSTGVGDINLRANGVYDEEQTYSVMSGVGSLEMTLQGEYNQPVHISSNSGVGDSKLDLTGQFNEGCMLSLGDGVGDVEVKLPSNIGIKISSSSITKATVKEGGNTIKVGNNSGDYTNDSYREGEPAIIIDISQGIGDIEFTIINQ